MTRVLAALALAMLTGGCCSTPTQPCYSLIDALALSMCAAGFGFCAGALALNGRKLR